MRKGCQKPPPPWITMNNIRRFQRTAAVSGKDGGHVFVTDRTNRGVFINDVKLRTFKQWKYFWKKDTSENKPISNMYRKQDKSFVQQIERDELTFQYEWRHRMDFSIPWQRALPTDLSRTFKNNTPLIRNLSVHTTPVPSTQENKCIERKETRTFYLFERDLKIPISIFHSTTTGGDVNWQEKRKKKTTILVRVRPKPNNKKSLLYLVSRTLKKYENGS